MAGTTTLAGRKFGFSALRDEGSKAAAASPAGKP
jgi:hypothetical protein